MVQLLDGRELHEVFRDATEQRLFKQLVGEITAAMYPFQPGDIWLELVHHPTDGLKIQITAIRNYPIVISNEMIWGHENRIGFIGHIVAMHFDSIYVQPDDHIQLGLE